MNNLSLIDFGMLVWCLARDLANWLGIEEVGLYNFKPSVRPVPLEVHIQVGVTSFSSSCSALSHLFLSSEILTTSFCNCFSGQSSRVSE